jgi:Protein of unknown function (DUF 659)
VRVFFVRNRTKCLRKNVAKVNCTGQWILGDSDFTTDGKVIFCQPCGKQISCDKKFQLTQRIKTNSHVSSKRLKRASTQTLLTERVQPSIENNQFFRDLCQTMLAANIPWNKLSNTSFRGFLEKYCGRVIPDESILRKKYLDGCNNSAIEEICESIGDSSIYVVVDETTDACGRYVANLLVGKLSEDEAGTPFLLTSKVLERTNHSTIARFVNDSLRVLWPAEGQEEKLRLLLSDAAAYMLKAGTALKVFYPNVIQVTCLSHGLNRVAEQVREEFPDVNKLKSNTKKVFIKAPLRVLAYKDQLPGIPLPPEPVLTRWGT